MVVLTMVETNVRMTEISATRAVRDCLLHFVDCVRHGSEPLASLDNTAQATVVLASRHECIATGQAQPVVDIAGYRSVSDSPSTGLS